MRITARDIERFTEGDCAILARAIHRLFGWPMAAGSEPGFPGQARPCDHAFVAIPGPNRPRRFLDIAGVHTAKQLCAEWGFNRCAIFTEEDFREHWYYDVRGFPSMFLGDSNARARQLAPMLVDNALKIC